MAHLNFVDVECLPVILKFIFQSAKDDTVFSVCCFVSPFVSDPDCRPQLLAQLRQSLDLSLLDGPKSVSLDQPRRSVKPPSSLVFGTAFRDIHLVFLAHAVP